MGRSLNNLGGLRSWLSVAVVSQGRSALVSGLTGSLEVTGGHEVTGSPTWVTELRPTMVHC